MKSEEESFKAIEFLLTLDLPDLVQEYLWDSLSKRFINFALAGALDDLSSYDFKLPDEYLLPLMNLLKGQKHLTPDEEDLLAYL